MHTLLTEQREVPVGEQLVNLRKTNAPARPGRTLFTARGLSGFPAVKNFPAGAPSQRASNYSSPTRSDTGSSLPSGQVFAVLAVLADFALAPVFRRLMNRARRFRFSDLLCCLPMRSLYISTVFRLCSGEL
jgi:hypothetical protein